MDQEIMVFGFGASCFAAASYLDQELVERVEKVVVAGRAEDMSDLEIEKIAIAKIRPYVGNVELIVICDALVAVLVKNRLEVEFPKQKFVYPSIEFINSANGTREMKARLKRSLEYQKAMIEDQGNLHEVQLWSDREPKNSLANKCILDGIKAAMGDRDKMIA